MEAEYKNILIGIVIGLLVGAGAGYFYGQSPIAGYEEDIKNLEAENLVLKDHREQLQEEITSIQDQVDILTANLTENLFSLKDLQTEFSKITTEYESLQLSYSELEGEYEELQLLYSVLEQDYNSLELSYEAVKGDYEKLRACIPPGVGILYSELKQSPEGYSRNELIGRCGQNYLIPAPINADIWEVNITLISELSWQNIQLKIYTVYEDYPLDWLGQPFAPYARGDGEVSISLTLNTSYAYVLQVRDAYAKPFTGFIEEHWYLDEKETPPKIDGFADEGEWQDFKTISLDYWATFNLSRRCEEASWDNRDKQIKISTIRFNSNLYICAMIPDDYLSEEFQTDCLFVYLDYGLGIIQERHMLWNTENEYRHNSWITNSFKNEGQYSHTGKGLFGEDGIYTVELKIPILNLADIEVKIEYVEATTYTEEGYFKESSHWKSNFIPINLLLE